MFGKVYSGGLYLVCSAHSLHALTIFSRIWLNGDPTLPLRSFVICLFLHTFHFTSLDILVFIPFIDILLLGYGLSISYLKLLVQTEYKPLRRLYNSEICVTTSAYLSYSAHIACGKVSFCSPRRCDGYQGKICFFHTSPAGVNMQHKLFYDHIRSLASTPALMRLLQARRV